MSGPLADFVRGILRRRGALIEDVGEDRIEALLPREVSRLLGADEYAVFRFSPNASPDGPDRWVSYDSDIFRAFENLLGDRGGFSVIRLRTPSLKLEKIEEKVHDCVGFNNAAFRLERRETARISYLATCARYAAVSDERREGLITSWVNEINLSSGSFPGEIGEFLRGFLETETSGTGDGIPESPGNRAVEQVKRPDLADVLRAAHGIQTERVREDLGDFVGSLERRLDRDIRRVNEYYRSLAGEARRRHEKKGAAGGGGEEEKTRILEKIEAIERERRGKVRDLIGKYALSIQVDPIASIRIEIEAPLFWLRIRRRKAARSFPLTYNPLLRKLDNLPCEVCYYPTGSYWVCDDSLHILCSRCLRGCRGCERPLCRRCHPAGCPRCGDIGE
ncbi:MAG: hypothetical protein HY760_02650 [Nitrospirae bacterium]|nr:hypothetical protein [Nitrospirota bacterium]